MIEESQEADDVIAWNKNVHFFIEQSNQKLWETSK